MSDPLADVQSVPNRRQDVTRAARPLGGAMEVGHCRLARLAVRWTRLHLYTIVATPFVAELLAVDQKDPSVGYYSSWIQASFLVGWALGGGLFGRLGDRLGRARALMLTILTYAMFTGLSFFAMTWWHLLICRFLAALGIGGEWAVGAALLSETWPRRWRPWIAAVLQTGVNVGIMLAMAASFLLSVFPSAASSWWACCRRVGAVDSPQRARAAAVERRQDPAAARRAARVGFVARSGATDHAADDLGLLAVVDGPLGVHVLVSATLPRPARPGRLERCRENAYLSLAMILLMVSSVAGNFVAAAIAKVLGYRRTLAWMFLGYFASMFACYYVERSYESLFLWLIALGASAGVFGLFTMYLPPLFPTLLRTTGAGFCYNIGRIAAAGESCSSACSIDWAIAVWRCSTRVFSFSPLPVSPAPAGAERW